MEQQLSHPHIELLNNKRAELEAVSDLLKELPKTLTREILVPK